MKTNDAVYSIRVRGHLDGHWGDWLGGFTVTHDVDGTTTLVGPVADQAELHGVLARLRDLGVTLLALTSPPSSPTTPSHKE